MPWLDGQPSLLQLASNWTLPSGAVLGAFDGQGRAPARSSLSVVVDVPPCQQAKQNDDHDSCYFLTHAFLSALAGRTPRCMSRSLSTSVLSWTVMIVYQCILGIGPRIEHQLPGKFISHTLSISRCGAIANRRGISIMGKTAGITALLPSGHFISSGMTLASKLECRPPTVSLWFWGEENPQSGDLTGGCISVLARADT